MIETLIAIAKEAGDEILKIYNDPATASVVDMKSDNSPLTLADKASHNVIVQKLAQTYPEIPILSEEGNQPEYEERSSWNPYFLIDPLDGTKEFINRNGEFTVNIALIQDRKPVRGVVHVPVHQVTYVGSEGEAYKVTDGQKIPIRISNKQQDRIAVRSKSHASPEEEVLFTAYDVVDFISVGSSLKFCMVAEGKADLYYRHGPTMEWDTAAGQAVLEAAGGQVYVGDKTDEFFSYNKQNLLNGSFLCLGF